MPSGVYERTEDHKRKISIALSGHEVSEEARKKMSIAKKGKKFSENHKKNMSIALSGENNPLWKGDNVGYNRFHYRIAKLYGKATICEFCGTTEAKKYDWANISGQLRTERDNWLRLCASCHKKYDNDKKAVQDNNGILFNL